MQLLCKTLVHQYGHPSFCAEKNIRVVRALCYKTNHRIMIKNIEINIVIKTKTPDKNIFLHFGSKYPAPVQVFLEPAKDVWCTDQCLCWWVWMCSLWSECCLPKSMCWRSTPPVWWWLGGRAFGRWSGNEGGALLMGSLPLQEMKENSCARRRQARRRPSANLKEAPFQTLNLLALWSRTSQPPVWWEVNIV